MSLFSLVDPIVAIVQSPDPDSRDLDILERWALRSSGDAIQDLLPSVRYDHVMQLLARCAPYDFPMSQLANELLVESRYWPHVQLSPRRTDSFNRSWFCLVSRSHSSPYAPPESETVLLPLAQDLAPLTRHALFRDLVRSHMVAPTIVSLCEQDPRLLDKETIAYLLAHADPIFRPRLFALVHQVP